MSVRVNPDKNGQCFIAAPNPGTSPQVTAPVLLGAVRNGKTKGNWLRLLFLRDYKHWPPTDGHELESGKEYTFNILPTSNILPSSKPGVQPIATIGPLCFGDLAIIDFYVDL